MNLKELLNEKHYTGPLYHATTLKATADIMREGFFVLSHAGPEPESVSPYDRSETKVWGDTINKTKKKDFNFFLSASRSKLNSYRVNLSNSVDCTIVLDSFFYNSLPYVHAMPVDHIAYWNKNQKRGSDTNEWLPISPIKWDKRSEAEERIWTSKKKLTIEGIKEIHFMSVDEEFDDDHPIYPINDLIELCRAKNVGLYIYVYEERNEISYDKAFKNYLYLNKKRAIKI